MELINDEGRGYQLDLVLWDLATCNLVAAPRLGPTVLLCF